MDFNALYTFLIEGREIASYYDLKNNPNNVATKIINYISNNSNEKIDTIKFSFGNLELIYFTKNNIFKYQIVKTFRPKINQATKNNSYPFNYDYSKGTFSNIPKEFPIQSLKKYLIKFMENDSVLNKNIGPLINSGPVVDKDDEEESDELVPRFLRNLKKNKRNFQQLSNWIKNKIK